MASSNPVTVVGASRRLPFVARGDTDHLVFGADYPFGMENDDATLTDLDTLALTPEDRRDVMGETAAELFDL